VQLLSLNFLKRAIEPSLLFNSINTLYGSIDADNEKARSIFVEAKRTCSVTNCMNVSLDHVPLEKEINYIRNFVTLQQLRTNDRLRVTVLIGRKYFPFQGTTVVTGATGETHSKAP